ncbi:hypothetical protein RM572_21880 [Streptomyces sp. DSM 42041]|uniref:Uncharacterized protein n=1 Tax=Streptomyces hazeniae TaxID=3075538 RepID=A0ABU2NY13_9ACTN|nr:hypothetical protein [Streptomyces sp. DSM 42041]MDT0381412.1 hypothetical protein [Streptomyces sp. DSM 42041]
MNPLSLGGIAVALAIVLANFKPWWKGGRDPKALVPFGTGAALGALATICAGGALGWGASGVASLISGAGDKAVTSVTGTGSAPVATASLGALTPPGGVVVFLLTIGVVLMWKSAGKDDKRRTAGGLITGATLGILPGVAAGLAVLPDAVNWIGAQGYGLLGGAA